MRNFCVWAAFFVSVSLSADYEIRHYKQSPPSSQVSEEASPLQKKRVVLTSLRGIVIAEEQNIPEAYAVRATSGVIVYGSNTTKLISSSQVNAFRRHLERDHIGKPLTLESIDEIKQKISKFYQNNGQNFVYVSVQPQDLTYGVLVVTVLHSKVGKVTVKGNKWGSEERYLSYLNLNSERILTGPLEHDLMYANRNLWHKMTLLYKEGDRYGTTDIDINVQDRNPLQVYSGIDNTGFKVIDYNRFFVGFNWGNFLDLDQILSYRYTSSLDFKKFQSHTLSYTAPLPWHHLFLAYGGYSKVEVSRPIAPLNLKTGYSWQFSSKYVIPFSPSPAWQQECHVGFDWKRTNNDLVVGEPIISASVATVFEMTGVYQMNYTTKNHYFTFQLEGFWQPWRLGQSMSREVYSQLRPGCKPQYFYTRLGGEYIWSEPATDLKVSLNVRGQLSTKPLIPLEQYGLGGAYSVRGYVERAVNVDDALIVNFEVRSPPTPILGRSLKTINSDSDVFRGIFFCDLGYGSLLSRVLGEPQKYFLAGIGPGIRYDIGTWLHFRGDWGFRLTKVPFGSPTVAMSQFHFSLILLY